MERVRNIRPPAVAGRFYPADADALDRTVRRCLAGDVHHGVQQPKALIVPHAGYQYSGSVAGSAYRLLRGATFERVVLIGPAHFVPTDRPALSGAGWFATPLGEVPVDLAAEQSLRDLVVVSEDAHRDEHSLEVQLPFLQVVLSRFQVVPVVVGRRGEGAAEVILDVLFGGPETLLVVSSDLSHYLPEPRARAVDAETAIAIEALEADLVDDERGCGAPVVRALLRTARSHGLTVTRLDLRTSADAGGPVDSVVGYGAFALS